MRDRHGWATSAAIGLGAVVGVAGCAQQTTDVQMSEGAALSGFNGLAAMNGLAGLNGLTGLNGLAGLNGQANANGLSALNGLAGLNGLAALNGLMTTDGGRKTVAYLVKCALASNDSLIKQDQNGTSYTFPGGLNLCPAWKTTGVSGDGSCQEAVSACMMAHINTAGIHIPIWIDSPAPTIGWGIDKVNFPFNEGSFFGNIIVTGPLPSKPKVNGPVAYFCDGAGFTAGNAGVVAGRLGAGQSNAPYANPFGNGVLCKNSYANTPYYTYGVGGQTDPDGYQKLEMPVGTPWNLPITIWRNNNYTPQFDAGYRYSISARLTQGNPMLIDATATTVQQWPKSANLDSSKFSFTPVGSSWKITLKSDANKCLDAGDGTAGRALTATSCTGQTNQSWTVTPEVQTGNFFIKVVSTNRCINVRNGSTAQGTIMEVADCNTAWDSEKFVILGVTDDASGGSSPPPAGTNPCAAYCGSPTVFTTASYNSGNLGTGAVCRETTATLSGGNRNNMAGRSFSINGVTMWGDGNIILPAKVNGGYCFQATAGGLSYAQFGTW